VGRWDVDDKPPGEAARGRRSKRGTRERWKGRRRNRRASLGSRKGEFGDTTASQLGHPLGLSGS